MIYIISGGIDTGKTTALCGIYENLKSGDGVASLKIFGNGQFLGYRIKRLSDGESKIIALKTGAGDNDGYFIPDDDIAFSFGDFSFSERAFLFANRVITDTVDKNISPVFIDEIGPVELNGNGLCEGFVVALNSGFDLYMVCREACIEAVISHFKIETYKIIKPAPVTGQGGIL
jgi:nucleoside-triphosphatase THEP1